MNQAMNESKTPRTTAFWNEWEPQCADATVLAEMLFEYGCEIETELAELQQKCESIGVIRDNQSRCIGDWMNYRDQIETDLAASRALSESLAKALDSISKWELPKHYELDYGSNGARDYIKGVAERALDAWRAAK